MEAMEVDSPVEMQGRAGAEPAVAAAAAAASAEDVSVPHLISDSGSSTEVDEDDDDNEGGQAAPHVPPRLPATWAFSQRVVGDSAATNSAAQGAPIRRRLR